MKAVTIITLLISLSFLSGCAGMFFEPGSMLGLPQKVAQRISDPIFNFTVDDANTTIAAVEAADYLTPEQKAEAVECPEAVIGLDRVRQELLNIGKEAEGRKGVIYFATIRRYREDPRDQIKGAAERVVSACAPLVLNDSYLVMKFMGPGI